MQGALKITKQFQAPGGTNSCAGGQRVAQLGKRLFVTQAERRGSRRSFEVSTDTLEKE